MAIVEGSILCVHGGLSPSMRTVPLLPVLTMATPDRPLRWPAGDSNRSAPPGTSCGLATANASHRPKLRV
jgi:hypothetical protein